MTFLAPVWIALAGAASIVVAAIHLIAWRLPRTVALPTTRFVPDEPARRAARTLRLADFGLLALRIGILMAAGVALARPVIDSRPTGRATVIAVDGSAAVGDTALLFDSLRSIPRGDATSFVVFDTTAQVTDEGGVARLMSRRTVPEASLSVGLLAASREARRLSRDYERVSVVFVSPFTAGSFDDATVAVRRLWPDSVSVVRVPAVPDPPGVVALEMPATTDDPVLAGIALARSNGFLRGASRLVRSVPTALDTAWVDSGRVLVIWPRIAAESSGTIAAVHANGYTAVGHFTRQSIGDSGRIVARWANGTAAAREIPRGTGCIRTIGFDVPDVGDFVLTPSFQRVASELLAPCGGRKGVTVVSDSMVAALIPPPQTIAEQPAGVPLAPDRLGAIIVMIAILLALIELLVRRRYGGATA